MTDAPFNLSALKLALGVREKFILGSTNGNRHYPPNEILYRLHELKMFRNVIKKIEQQEEEL